MNQRFPVLIDQNNVMHYAQTNPFCYVNTYTYAFYPAQYVWTATHNLGTSRLIIKPVDDFGNPLTGIITLLNNNVCTITFSQPVTGTLTIYSFV